MPVSCHYCKPWSKAFHSTTFCRWHRFLENLERWTGIRFLPPLVIKARRWTYKEYWEVD